MTKLPALIAFDLDDTLAPSKSPVPGEILELLARLLVKTSVAVISGGNITQFQTQLLTPLESLSATGEAAEQADPQTGEGVTEEQLSRLHILPTCGTHYERRADGAWQTVYRETLTVEEREQSLAALKSEAQRLGLWESETWGDILEDRGSQVTFSALGQEAPVGAKAAWDPTGAKKNELAAAVQLLLPELEVRSGGSTSVDITRKGIDKAYGMKKLTAHTDIPLSEMLFIGDRLDPAGNDYPVKELGVRCIAVENWQDTAALLTRLLAEAEENDQPAD